MGEGKRDAVFTVLGGIAGVLTYTLIQQYAGIPVSGFDAGKISLADLIRLGSFSLSVVYSTLLMFVIFMADRWEQNRQKASLKEVTIYVQE